MIGLFFTLAFSFKLTKRRLIGLLVSLITVQFMVLTMVDIPLNQLIVDSVKYAKNHWIVAWLIFEALFILLTLLLINSMKYIDESKI